MSPKRHDALKHLRQMCKRSPGWRVSSVLRERCRRAFPTDC